MVLNSGVIFVRVKIIRKTEYVFDSSLNQWASRAKPEVYLPRDVQGSVPRYGASSACVLGGLFRA